MRKILTTLLICTFVTTSFSQVTYGLNPLKWFSNDEVKTAKKEIDKKAGTHGIPPDMVDPMYKDATSSLPVLSVGKNISIPPQGAYVMPVENQKGKPTDYSTPDEKKIRQTPTNLATQNERDRASGKFHKRYSGSSNSLVDGLNATGSKSSYKERKKIASANGIRNYKGTASQNTTLLNKLKRGQLRKG